MSYATEVLADTPYRYFRMGQPSGTEPDATGSATVLTPIGSPTRDIAGGLTSGDDGAMQFNGTSQAASVPLDLTTTTVITVEAWVWWNAYNSTDDHLLMEFTPAWFSFVGAFVVDMNNSSGGVEASTISIGWVGTAGASRRVTIPQSAIPAAGWHHFALVLDVVGLGTCKVYVDGAPVTVTDRISGSPPSGTFANDTLYLMSRAGTSLFGAGKLDELAIYKSELSSTRIAAHVAAAAGSGALFTKTGLGIVGP